MVASIIALSVWSLDLGIDFTGGSILEVSYTEEKPSAIFVEETLVSLELSGSSVRVAGENGYIIRTPFLAEETRVALIEALGGEDQLNVDRFSSVGPTIGEELRSKALIAIVIVVAAIILFIAFAFRKVGKPISSWMYGLAAIGALIHDVLIPVGIFAVLGAFLGMQVDTLFVMALLAILGFSVNDTIVVFDRVRENLKEDHDHGKNEPFERIVGSSLSQTYARSLNTSLTTLVVLIALFVLGGPTIHTFVLTLILGVIFGTYSSIFLASPLLVLMAGKKR